MANSQVFDATSSDSTSAVTPTTLLFRHPHLLSKSSLAFASRWTQSARTSYSRSAAPAFLTEPKAQTLIQCMGLRDAAREASVGRLTKSTSIGATFVHSHDEYPTFHSRSDSNAYHGVYSHSTFARFWTLSVEAGATVTDGVTTFSVLFLDSNLTPVLVPVNSSFHTVYPSGSAKLVRKFRRSDLTFSYVRGLNSGNGAYSTTRQEDARVAFSYTATRKINLGLDGGHYSLSALGQTLGKYAVYSGAAGFTYGLGHALHLSARYDLRDQQIDLPGYRRTSTRATLGLVYSPGTLPLALW